MLETTNFIKLWHFRTFFFKCPSGWDFYRVCSTLKDPGAASCQPTIVWKLSRKLEDFVWFLSFFILPNLKFWIWSLIYAKTTWRSLVVLTFLFEALLESSRTELNSANFKFLGFKTIVWFVWKLECQGNRGMPEENVYTSSETVFVFQTKFLELVLHQGESKVGVLLERNEIVISSILTPDWSIQWLTQSFGWNSLIFSWLKIHNNLTRLTTIQPKSTSTFSVSKLSTYSSKS